MTITKQKEILTGALLAYRLIIEDISGGDEDAVETIKEQFGLTDKDVKEINKMGRKFGYKLTIIGK